MLEPGAESLEVFVMEELRIQRNEALDKLERAEDALRSLLQQATMHELLKGVNGDWACRRCRPYSDMLEDGFLCGYHKAKEYFL